MRIYVEAPFVWQLALRQEYFAACRQLLDLASTGSLELALPLTAFIETLTTVRLRTNKRNDLKNSWREEARQLARTNADAYQDAAKALQEALLKTAEMASDERRNLDAVIAQIGTYARILSPTIGHFTDAHRLEAKGSTELDALAIACILADAHGAATATDRALLALDRKAVEKRKATGLIEDLRSAGIKVFVTPKELAPWLASKGIELALPSTSAEHDGA